MNMVATGLGRMRSSRKTSLEYINLLQERGIDAIGYLADAHGMSKADIYEGISKNLFDGAESAKIIAEAMGRDYSGSMAAISQTFDGLSSTLQGMNEEIDKAMGEGYNEKRKEGMERQIGYLQGEYGEQQKEANKMLGAWKADLENQKDEMLRQAEIKVMRSDEYQQATSC